jgi:hypothetical protein
MAVNQRVFDTAILYRSQNARAVTNNLANGANNLFFVKPDGTLFVLAGVTGFDNSRMKTSTDNGFTWSDITNGRIDVTARTDNVAEGPTQAFFQNEEGDYYWLTCSNGQIWFYRTSDKTYNTFYGEITTKYGSYTDTCLNNFFATTGDGNTLIYMAYLNASKDLKMIGIDMQRTLQDMPQDFVSYGTLNWASGVLAVKSAGAKVHTIAVCEDIPDMLCHIPFTKKQGTGTGTWGTYNIIASGTSAAGISSYIDLAVDVDKSGNIGMTYSKRNGLPGTAISGWYAISNNGGTTWTNIYNPPPTGYSGYVDAQTGKLTGMNDIMGGYSGSFLLSSVFMKDGSGTLFVKEIPSVVTDYIAGGMRNVIVGQSGLVFASGLSTTWTSSTTGTVYNLKGIAHNGTLFAAVGDSGLIITSDNGSTWTQRTTGTTQNLNAIAYNGSGQLCAVGNAGTVLTSTNGTSWTAQTGALSNNLYCICNWNPIFMWAVGGTAGEFQTSPDGVNWTSRNTGQSSYNWYGVAANSTTLVAVAEAGIIRSTPNAVTWTNRTSNTSQDLNAAVWTGGTFVAAGNAGTIRTNPSGTSTWTTQASGTTQNLYGLTYGNSKVNLVGNGGYYATSTDGSGSWTTVNVPVSGNLRAFASGIYAGSNTSTDDWRQVNSVSGNVLGGKFFKYMDEAIPNFGDKSAIRMAYQLGETNSKYGSDTVYSRIYHERLSNLAFPIAYSGTAFTKDDIDYYASGYINDQTQLYIDKITDLGMTYSFSRYDPLEDSEIIGRGSYGQPITFEDEACVDPGSYGFATVARNNADFSDYIERDTRKIFYKPNLYLPRTFVLNKGGYLKRTIWTVRIMGNDYELAQIVPRFLDGKILYYEANLYVIGPSNDPFTKVILPSET